MGDPIRIQKILAQAGFGSRRSCETFIEEGRVTVDGAVIRQLGSKADPETQVIELDGQKVAGPGRTSKSVRDAQDKVYYMLNKPRGVLSTNEDPSGRPLAIQLVPEKRRIYCVGRLDLDTEGLLLLTNDGEITNHLTHPRFGVDKIYIAKVDGSISAEQIKKLERGVHLAEGKTQGAGIRIRKRGERTSVVELKISEGMNRQVRRMLAAVGLYVRDLKRVGVGPLRLGDLPLGASRRLSGEELERLQAAIRHAQVAAQNKPKRGASSEVPEEHEEEEIEEEVEVTSRPWEKRERKGAGKKAAPAAKYVDPEELSEEEKAAAELADEDLGEDDDVLEELTALDEGSEEDAADEDLEPEEVEEEELPDTEPEVDAAATKDLGAPVERDAAAALASAEERDRQRVGKLSKKPWNDRGEGAYEGKRPRAENRGGDRERPWEKREGAARSGAGKPWEKRERSGGAAGAKPWQKREGGAARGGAGAGKPWEKREGAARGGKPWEKREGGAGRSDRPWDRERTGGAREGGGERKPWQARGEGGARPWQKREGAERGGQGGSKPWQKREGGAARGGAGAGKPWEKREGGERGGARGGKPWEKREGSARSAGASKPWERREGGDRGGARGGKPWEKREGSARSAGASKPWERREGGDRGGARGGKPWEKREGGAGAARGGKPWEKREGSRGGAAAGKPWERREGGSGGARGGKPWVKREGSAGAGKPWEKREGSSRGGAGAGKPWVKREGSAGAGKPWEKRERSGGSAGGERGGSRGGSRDRGASSRPWEPRGGGEGGGNREGGGQTRSARPWERKHDADDE